MRFAASLFPDMPTLTRGLSSVLGEGGAVTAGVDVVDRQPSGQGTFPKEIITCRRGDGTELRVFCKYGSDCTSHNCHGHRGGVAYEAAVYRDVLARSRASTPRFFGTYTEGGAALTWLVLEYLPDGIRLARAAERQAMPSAARWIGRFHAEQQARRAAGAGPSLLTYDAGYYQGWARRTDEFAGDLHLRFPWLGTLCRRFTQSAAALLESVPTVIHGEYYPAKNILYSRCTIYPVDWESAAVGAGEIDLATLTERWPPEVVRDCEQQYRRTRWPGGGPPDFERRLGAARLYVGFRWLGEAPEETRHQSKLWRFEELRRAGERLGWI
jgi:hypothetical protein